ncbi:MAG: hypothetical protein ACRECY_18530 [Phyllobacterium sp.]
MNVAIPAPMFHGIFGRSWLKRNGRASLALYMPGLEASRKTAAWNCPARSRRNGAALNANALFDASATPSFFAFREIRH